MKPLKLVPDDVDEHVIGEAVRDAIDNQDGHIVGTEIFHQLNKHGYKLVPHEKDRADGRKAHYGAGEQLLDIIVRMGWGPGFCAGNVLKYLRRDKEVVESLVKARWYYKYIQDGNTTAWHLVLGQLELILTNDELKLLRDL